MSVSQGRTVRRAGLGTILAVIALAVVTPQGRAAVVFDPGNGAGPPPAAMGGIPVGAYPGDGRAEGIPVADAPAPNGETIGFDPVMTTRNIGSQWQSSPWAGGTYSGRIYSSVGTLSRTLTLSRPARAFGFFADPNRFGDSTIRATAQDGTTSGDVVVSNFLPGNGAPPSGRFFGFYGTGGDRIASVTITAAADTLGFAIGYFHGSDAVDAACDEVLAPVGCWAFDEAAGPTATDSTAFGNDGTYLGGPLLGAPGVVNTAVSMDGKDDRVMVPDSNSLDVGDTFTLEGWVKRDSDNRIVQLFNKGNRSYHLVLLGHYDGNRVLLRKANVTSLMRSQGGVPADGGFHHVVVGRNGHKTQMFIDGVEQQVDELSGFRAIEDNTLPLYMSGTSNGDPVNGDLDEFAVYDRQLTYQEVQDRFARGTQPPVVRSGRAGRASSATGNVRAARASVRGVGAARRCARLGTLRAGVTRITSTLRCGTARRLLARGPAALERAGLRCNLVRESWRGRGARLGYRCRGTHRATLRYTTVG